MLSVYRTKFVLLAFSVTAIVLAGCAGGTLSLKEDNIEEKIAGSPFVVKLSKNDYPQGNQSAANVEVFYKTWNALTEPSAIYNWKYHYQIAEGSDPKHQYEALSEITYYQKSRNDLEALTFLRGFAAKHGGDALVSTYRSPVLDRLTMPANILGYRYHTVVVRYERAL